MKKKYFLLPITVIFAYLTFTSMSGGPGGDYTVAGCSCHNPSSSPSTLVTIQLLQNPSLAPVSNYVAGGSYIIRINGTNTGGTNLPNYGFQLCAVQTSSPSTTAGSLSAIGGTHLSFPGITLVEHSSPQTPFSGTGGTGTVYRKDIPWIAPSSGFGTVTLRGIINPINTISGPDAGDLWNNTSANVQELTQITGTATVCAGSTTTLSNTLGGGTWSSSTPATGTVSTGGVVAGLAAGTTIITYTAGGNFVTRIVTVNANPGSFGGTPVVCMTNTTTITNSTGGGTWTSGSTGIATVIPATGVVTGVSAGTSLMTYAIGTCSATTTVTVNSLIANTGVASVCAGQTTTLFNVMSGGTWSSSIPATGTVNASGVVTGIAAGTTNVSYTLPTGCTSVTTVTVNAMPGAIGGPLAVCQGNTVTATNSAGGGTWSTSTGTGSVTVGSSSGVVTGSTAGTANITYTLSGGCFATAVVTIHPTPSTISGITTFCANATTSLSATPAGGTWTSNNTAIAIAAPTTGVISGGGLSGGVTIITYTAPTGCIRITNVNVQAISPVSGTLTLCQGSAATLSSAPSGGTWTSGATGTATVNATSGLVAGVGAGTATITYTVSSGCSSSSIVTVNPAAPITGGGSICTGSSLTLSNTVSGGTWSSSAPAVGTISTSGAFTGVANGTSTVAYTTSNGCVSTTVVTVNAAPGAVTGTGAGTFCGSATIGASGGSGGTIYYQGTTAGGTSTTTPATSQVVTSTGTYYFRVQSAAGCWGPEAAISVTVNPTPTAIGGIAAICAGSTASLSSTPTGGTWASSSTATGTINAGTGLFTAIANGTTTITYTSLAGCTNTGIITVNAAPGIVTGTGAGTFCGSTTIGATGGAGGTIYYQGTTAGGTSTAAPTAAQVVSATGTYYFRVQSAAGCWGSEAAINVTINPIPASISGTTSVCAGATTTLSSTPSGGTWSSSNAATGTIDIGTGVITGIAPGTTNISYTLAGCSTGRTQTVLAMPSAVTVSGGGTFCTSTTITASGGTGGTIYYQGTTTGGTSTATPATSQSVTSSGTYYFRSRSAAGCWGTEGSVVITINPAPAAITGPAAICDGTSATLSSGTSGGTWSSSNATVASIEASTGIASGVSSGTTNITYTNTATGCFTTRILTVHPLPAAISGNSNLCKLSSTLLSSSTTGGTWSSSDVAVAVVGSTSGNVIGVDVGTALISYTLGTGCKQVKAITVNPLPAAISGGNTAICVDGTASLSNAAPGGTWGSSNTTVATVNTTSGLVTANASGTSTITYTLPTGCTATTNITVNALPLVPSGSLSACIGQTTTLNSTPAGGTWTSSSPVVATIGSSNGIVSGISSGTTTISYTLSTGCANTAIVSVNPLPTAIAGTATTCVGVTTTLSSTPAGGTWTSNNTSIATIDATTGTLTGAGIGNTTITYAVSSGCFATTTATINSAPSAGTLSGSTSVCTGLTVSFTSTIPGGTWASSDAGIASVDATTGTVTGVLAGTATMTYTLTTACGTVTATRTITVTTSAVAGAISGPANTCPGSTIALSSSVTGGTWTSSNTAVAGISSSGGVLSGVSPGTTEITYTISSSCGTATATTIISVNPLPAAITGASTVCVNAVTNLSNTGGGTWTSGNTLIASADPTTGDITGINPGVTNITYTLPTGCIATKLMTVLPLPSPITGATSMCVGTTTLLTNPTAGGTWSSSNSSIASIGSSSGTVLAFGAGTAIINYTLSATGCARTAIMSVLPIPSNISGTTSICAGANTTLANATSGGTWSSSNTTVVSIGATTGVAAGSVAGTSVITYQLPTGCRRLTTMTVNALPAAITGGSSICVGQSSTLTTTTIGGTWSSGSAGIASVSATTGTVTAIAPGTSAVTYTTAAGCTRSIDVTVNAVPSAITGSGSICSGSTTTLATATTGGVWTSNNTLIASVSATTGVVTGALAGTTTISYTLPTGCFATAAVTTNALPGTITGPVSVCLGSTMALGSSPSGGTWTSSTGNASVGSTSGIVTGISAGTTTITYTLPTGCINTRDVAVNPVPAPISGTMALCEGATTTLSTTSSGGSWSSSATGIVSFLSPSIATAVSPGTATVTYAFATGCNATAVITVNALPAAIAGPALVCEGANVTLTSTTAGGTWSSSASVFATVDATTGIVTGVSSGSAMLTYTLPTGCLRTSNIAVNPLPHAGSLSGPTDVCVGATATLATTSTGGFWGITTGNVSIATTGIMTGIAAGVDTVRYSVTNGCGTDLVKYPVTVNPLPAAGTITGSSNVCVGGALTLANAASGGAWSSSNTSVATVSGLGIVLASAVGTTTISYTVTNSCGTATTTKIITVHPIADAGTISGNDTMCAGTSITLTNTGTGGTWSSTSIAIAPVTGSGVVTGITPGSTTIRYIVANACSSDTATHIIVVTPAEDCETRVTGVPPGMTISIFPNPTNGVLNVSSPTVGELKIYTIDGRELAHYDIATPTAVVTMPTGVAAGLYVCRFKGADGNNLAVRILYAP